MKTNESKSLYKVVLKVAMWKTLSITYGYYQNVTWYIGDWGHYFDMGMIIGRGVFFFFSKF
jgi:hypothetical protein